MKYMENVFTNCENSFVVGETPRDWNGRWNGALGKEKKRLEIRGGLEGKALCKERLDRDRKALGDSGDKGFVDLFKMFVLCIW